MHEFIHRDIEQTVIQHLKTFPAVAILGPRQSGKSTLVKKMASRFSSFLYMDLQNRDDLNRLTEPTLFFEANDKATICLDEIRLVPHLMCPVTDYRLCF